jgi:mono/diheme cytochrome c family protein
MTIVFALLLAQAGTDAALVARGDRIFAQSCSVGYCHGVAGAAGRGPRLRGRSFAKDYLYSVVRDGIPSSAMPAWKDRLKDEDIRAVAEYVASLATAADVVPPANPMPPGVGPASQPVFNGPPQAARGRALFSDPVRENCSICHAVRGHGIAVGPDLTAPAEKTATEMMSRIHSTQSRHVLTASLQSGEQFPALLVSQTGDEVRLYDLTSMPPVLRTFAQPQVVSLAQNPAWRHEDVSRNYSAADLEDIAAYLRWAATGR